MPAQRSPGRRARFFVRDNPRRGWLPSSLGGIGVGVLGIALAGSLTVPTSAQPPTPSASSAPIPSAPAPSAPALSAPTSATPTIATPAQPSAAETPGSSGPTVSGAVAGSRVPGPGATPSVDPSVTAPYQDAAAAGQTVLREAIVAEHAAQRAEGLAKDAEEVGRAARTATGKARQQKLDAVGEATQARGEQLAKEALARAVAARLAAVRARLAAEAAAQQAAAQQAAAQEAAAQEAADRQAAAAASAAARQTTQAVPTSPAQPAGDPTTARTDPPLRTTRTGVSPVPGAVVGAGFHEYGLWARYHTGLDFRAAYGVPIRAVKGGVVLYAGNSGNWSGNHVAIRHADGMTSMSSHMSSIRVSAGQTVQTGDVIGYVGATGRAFGAHLHFEVYPVGVRYGDIYRAVNPVPWLREAGVITR